MVQLVTQSGSSDSIDILIHAVEQADSPDRLVAAVAALAAARSVAALPTLIQALGYNNPGAAVMAVQGLVQMGEAAVLPLLDQLDDYNYGARAYSIRALAAIGDLRALEVLLAAAETDFAPSVRRAATKGLGTLKWQQQPLQDDQAASQAVSSAQDRVLTSLLAIAQDSDWSIRYAAVVGLQALAIASTSTPAHLVPQILTHLQHQAETEPDLAVQARVRLALTALNPMAIAQPSFSQETGLVSTYPSK